MGVEANGMLFVAADIGAEHETEFNDWYDHEHVEERARIEGFIFAARYKSVNGGKSYLGLYRTQSLKDFTSPAYKAAFGKQTQWSVTNLNRMIAPTRRVSAVEAVVGQGSGSWISVLAMSEACDQRALVSQVADFGKKIARQPGVVQSYLLVPDPALSSPLPTEQKDNRVMYPIAVIEATSRAAIDQAVSAARTTFGATITDETTYALLWKLYAAELAPKSSL
jgi:hypothetical protein